MSSSEKVKGYPFARGEGREVRAVDFRTFRPGRSDEEQALKRVLHVAEELGRKYASHLIHRELQVEENLVAAVRGPLQRAYGMDNLRLFVHPQAGASKRAVGRAGEGRIGAQDNRNRGRRLIKIRRMPNQCGRRSDRKFAVGASGSAGEVDGVSVGVVVL